MRTIGIIQARMGSSRFPGKILETIAGESVLEKMLHRVCRSERLTEVVIATTELEADQPIVDWCKQVGTPVFRGSEQDVLDRYYRAACAHRADAVVRLTSDCPLMDPKVVDVVVDEFAAGGYDFVSNTEPPPSTWPDGLDVSVMSIKALRRAWQEARKPSEREHVTFYFWNNPALFRQRRIEHVPDWSSYRLTVDYPPDLELARRVYEALLPKNSDFTLTEIVTFLDAHPQIRRLNEHYVRGQGWQAAFDRDRSAGFS